MVPSQQFGNYIIIEFLNGFFYLVCFMRLFTTRKKRELLRRNLFWIDQWTKMISLGGLLQWKRKSFRSFAPKYFFLTDNKRILENQIEINWSILKRKGCMDYISLVCYMKNNRNIIKWNQSLKKELESKDNWLEERLRFHEWKINQCWNSSQRSKSETSRWNKSKWYHLILLGGLLQWKRKRKSFESFAPKFFFSWQTTKGSWRIKLKSIAQ